MSDSDVYLPSASFSESCDASQVVKEKSKVASAVQPYEGEPRASEIWAKSDKDGFLPAVFRSRLNTELPLLNV